MDECPGRQRGIRETTQYDGFRARSVIFRSLGANFHPPRRSAGAPGSCSRDSSCDESVGPAELSFGAFRGDGRCDGFNAVQIRAGNPCRRIRAGRRRTSSCAAAATADSGPHPAVRWWRADQLPLTAVAEELRYNRGVLRKTYGVDVRPYFRPRYGQHNAHVDKISDGRVRWRTTS
jgi:hypothetical protein